MSQSRTYQSSEFFTPEKYIHEQATRMESNRGNILFASCTSGTDIAGGVVKTYENLLYREGNSKGILFLKDIDGSFSDTETVVRLQEHVGGADVYLFQSLLDPITARDVNDNYMRFLIAVRAFKEHGAHLVTGVLPYLAYARQDKPTKFQREPTTAKLTADLGVTAGLDRIISWHPHSSQISGFYGNIPVHMLDPLTLFEEVFKEYRDREDVIAVAPDAGATKLIMHFSREMNVNSAIAAKYRPKSEEAVITDIIGDFRKKKTALVMDDMISSAGTVESLITKLIEDKGIEEVHLCASHNLCLQGAYETLSELHQKGFLSTVTVTDSIPQSPEFKELPFFSVEPLEEIFCRTINRIHYNRSVSEVFKKNQDN
jgi:ribose-phosphate pyrophosphokinase